MNHSRTQGRTPVRKRRAHPASKAAKPVPRIYSGELVLMASAASMGAELIDPGLRNRNLFVTKRDSDL